MMGMSPGGGPPTGASPSGVASSPLHSTPQSPLMSPSPSMQPSPLMQHSPMASPLTPSPGPAGGSMTQTSPRGPLNSAVHMMDDSQFSPNTDGANRVMGPNSGPGRMHQMSSFRVAPPPAGGHQIMISQGGGMNPNNPGIGMTRGMNSNMAQMQHNRPMDGQMQRMRSTLPQDHIR